MHSRSDLHETITRDQEAIVLLAHKLCVSERKRLAWQKTAEMQQDRANDNDRKFKEVVEKLKDEEARCALLQAGEDLSKVEQHTTKDENARLLAHAIDLDKANEAHAAPTRQPESDVVKEVRRRAADRPPNQHFWFPISTIRELFALIDAPRPVLTHRQHVDALVAMGAVESVQYRMSSVAPINILILPDTGADDAT